MDTETATNQPARWCETKYVSAASRAGLKVVKWFYSHHEYRFPLQSDIKLIKHRLVGNLDALGTNRKIGGVIMSEEVNEEGAISSKGLGAGADLCEEEGQVAEGDRGLTLMWATQEAYLPKDLPHRRPPLVSRRLTCPTTTSKRQ